MASYPIWNNVMACCYKSDKSFGAQRTCEVEVRVGTSAKNSHHFVDHRVTHREHPNGTKEYRFYVDDVLVKKSYLTDDGFYEEVEML